MNNKYYISNYRKFAELLVYLLSQLDGPINETKALKLLYFADAENYEKHDTTISNNVTYYKNHFGPTPNFRILKNIYEALSDYVSREEKQNEDYKSCMLRLKDRGFTFKSLSAGEMEIIDEIVSRYGGLSLTEVVRLAHFDPPYLASQKHKKINFSFVKFRKSDEDYESDLNEEVQKTIASDISIQGRRKLKEYAGAKA